MGYYTVDENTPTLGEVAVFLYGKAEYATEIARWNHLRKPFALELGQKLALRLKPRLSPRRGRAKLLAMWRARLSNGHQPKVEPLPEAPAAQAQQAQSPPQENAESTSPGQPAPSPAPLTPAQMVEQGRNQLDQGHPDRALAFFKQARALDPKPVQPWFLEFSTLRTLQREDELKSSVAIFLKTHPSYQGSQVIRLYLASPAQAGQPGQDDAQ